MLFSTNIWHSYSSGKKHTGLILLSTDGRIMMHGCWKDVYKNNF
jgi:hypothetical protein